jgi:hypothetical protein
VGREQVGCVAKTHWDAERCVIARSTHPIGSRPSPAGARLDPSLEPRRSAVLISGLATGPPAGVGGGLGPFLAG